MTFGPAAADQDRQLADRRRVELLEPRLDPRQRVAQVAHAVGRGAELVAVLVVVALEPAGADAEDRAAAGDVVDRAVRVGQQLGVAVRVADHQRADLRALGDLGQRGQRRDALEVLAVGVAAQREEVVPGEDRVDAELLGLAPRPPHPVEVRVHGLDLDTDAHGSHARAP